MNDAVHAVPRMKLLCMSFSPHLQRFIALTIFAFLSSVLGYFFGPFYASSRSTYAPPLEHEAAITAVTTISETTPRILLVSSFFPLSVSKHSTEKYNEWFTEFLSSITTEVYFFTTPALAEHIRSLRGSLPITINTTFSSPFDIPPLHGLEEHYYQMHALDREKKIHGPELYAVWNTKAYFLDAGVRNTGGKWDYAFWNDAGSFRGQHDYRLWPDPRRVDALWEEGSKIAKTCKEDLLFFPMMHAPSSWWFKNWKESKGPIDMDFSEGSFFGGSPASVRWFRQVFYAYHDYYLSQGFFIGKDQTVFNTLFFLFPSRFITTWFSNPRSAQHIHGLPPFDTNSKQLGICGSDWYYYQFFLASAEDRQKMQTRLNAQYTITKTKLDKWQYDGVDLTCRLTDSVSMGDVLRGQFGDQWQSPVSTVDLLGPP